MNLSSQSLNVLAGVVTGDRAGIYRTRVDLEILFHELGFDAQHEDATSRHKYALSKLTNANGTPLMIAVIKATLDPRNFVDREYLLSTAIEELNKHFKYDHFEVYLQNNVCNIRSFRSTTVIAKNLDFLSDEFIREQLQKCESKITNGDFDGAITNARSLIEGVIGHIYERITGSKIEGSGDLQKDFRKVRDSLQMAPEKYTSESIRQVLNGFSSIVQGIDSLSNQMGDRHRRRFKPASRHAQLVTNTAMTIVDFLIESYNAQSKA